MNKIIKRTCIILVCTIFELYSIQDELVKEAFHQLDKPQQTIICQSIKEQKPFMVTHNGHAIQMMKIQDDGRVRIFKDRQMVEVLTAAFEKLCK